MRKKIMAAGVIGVMILSSLWGCSSSDNETEETKSSIEQTGDNKNGGSDNSNDNSQINNESAARFDIEAEHVQENEQTVAVKVSGKLSGEGADVVVEAGENNLIAFDGDSVKTNAVGAAASDGIVTVNQPGTYIVTGTAKNGQIVVDTQDKGTVWIILADADITSSVNSPIYVKNASKTIVSAAIGTENTLTDAKEYTYDISEDEEPNACIFSKDDLVISGGGKLTVNGNFNNGIAGKDTLEINDIKLTVNAKNNGIKGKDYLVIRSGEIEIESDCDGLKSDNSSDASLGYILIEDGNIKITAGEDGIQAETCMKIAGGTIDITTGGGAGITSASSMWGGGNTKSDTSKKGIKAGVDITITEGNITINSEDDSIHTNNSINIDGGKFIISSGDDGIHSDSELKITDGTIDIKKSYEGIESAEIIINGGHIDIISSDDGINAAGGNDGSSMGGRPGMNGFSSSTGNMEINGGEIYINASSDGLDSNGNITMTGGEVYIDGPENDGNGALDYDSTFNMTGGILIAAGSSGMLQSVSTSSTQYCITVVTSSYQNGGTEFVLTDSSKNKIADYTPSKKYNSIVVCTPDIKKGETYTAYFGGVEEGFTEVTSILSNIGERTGLGGNGGFGGGHGGRRDNGEAGAGMTDDNQPPDNFNGERPDNSQMPDDIRKPDDSQKPDNSQIPDFSGGIPDIN